MTRNRWTPWEAAPGTDGEAETVRVYCLPHAGGSAGSYLAWSRSHEVPGLKFVPVELPGRGTRLSEPLLDSMDEVVDGFLTVLAERPEQERFLLLGHSMGAQIAFETTRRLAQAGRPLPRVVVVSGCRPPGAPVALPLHDRSDEELLRGLVELGGTPAEILEHRELLAMLLPVMRADLGLLARYMTDIRPTVLPCPMVALGGADDRLAGPEWITGWRAMTAGGFRHRVLPGDHFFLHARPAEVMAEIAAAVQEHAASTAG
ncbi:alpha/beta fold hydrolase [Streptomyces sp. RerS4]|uniref:thioesterase II family protein n=1 Tax=Streptomyces sp. RerS4 TaxID=2942449 RepID=UPI00201BD9F3|nr:alpha/beta fold hydrolase [Streptomyces sp. RerS4]UQW99655.1 alpha/beta fold hydrolase [Streptomyces sp. RerS4]